MKNIGWFSPLVYHVNTGIVEISGDLVMATVLALLLTQLNIAQPVFYRFTSFDFRNFLDILFGQFLYICITALYICIALMWPLRNVKVEIGVEMLITRSCISLLLFLPFLLQEFEDSLQSWRDLHDVLFPSQRSD